MPSDVTVYSLKRNRLQRIFYQNQLINECAIKNLDKMPYSQNHGSLLWRTYNRNKKTRYLEVYKQKIGYFEQRNFLKIKCNVPYMYKGIM